MAESKDLVQRKPDCLSIYCQEWMKELSTIMTSSYMFLKIDHGLRCSRSYLLSMIKKIQNAFNTVGFERYPFARVDGKAYVIDRSCLERIYVVKTSS